MAKASGTTRRASTARVRVAKSDIIGLTTGTWHDQSYKNDYAAEPYKSLLDEKEEGLEWAEQNKAIKKGIDNMKINDFSGGTFRMTTADGSELRVDINPTGRWSDVKGYYVGKLKVGTREIDGFSRRNPDYPIFATKEKAKSYAKHVLVTQAEQNSSFKKYHKFD